MKLCIGYGRTYNSLLNVAVSEAIAQARIDIDNQLSEYDDSCSVMFLQPNVNIILEKDGRYTCVIVLSANVNLYETTNRYEISIANAIANSESVAIDNIAP